MLVVSVGTPNFNDYGEWNISGFRLSPFKYDPNDNEVELKTYIDSETKVKFEELAQEHGFDSISSVLRVYIKTCVMQHSLNLDLTQKNTVTNPDVIEAINQTGHFRT